jgi:hypothetical protein
MKLSPESTAGFPEDSNWMWQRRNLMKLLAIFFIVLAAVAPLFGQDEEDSFPKLKLGAVLDGRLISAGDQDSWLDSGFGKNRYGGEDGDRDTVVRLSQAAVLASASFSESFSTRIHLNIDAEPERGLDRNRIDVIEALAAYRSFLSSSARIRIRGGIFFPPVSLENTGPAWTSPYTITTSAINSWIGEEVRATGGEAAFTFSGNSNEFTVVGAIFGMNDPSGTLLAWRGWSLHDRQSGYSDRLPLPPIQAISPDGLFPRQPRFVEPFREVDGRPGYYAGAQWTRTGLDISFLGYDNRGNPEEFDGTQYGWDTNFLNFGAHARLPGQIEILGQYLTGDSRMGFYNMVYIGFSSGYVLGTVLFGNQRFTIRYDRFKVKDQDRFREADDNREDGDAWTADYILETGEKHRLAFELLRISGDRPAAVDLNLPRETTEYIFQISFRIRI